MRQVRFADEHLNEYGFTADRCDRVFNEWLPLPSRDSLGTARQAALVAAELVDLQRGPCDMAMIYDAKCGGGDYSPLLDPSTCSPRKAYYAFMAFNELRKAGIADKTQVEHDAKAIGCGGTAVRAVAAGGNGGVDGKHNWEVVPWSGVLSPWSIAVLSIPAVVE